MFENRRSRVKVSCQTVRRDGAVETNSIWKLKDDCQNYTYSCDHEEHNSTKLCFVSVLAVEVEFHGSTKEIHF